MKKLLPLVAGITLLVGVSAVNASEPVLLTTDQMDQVTAGGDENNIFFTLISLRRQL